MAITTRVRTSSTIDRIRATPAHGALNPRAGQTGELTHAEIETIGAASLAITASLNMEQVLATVSEQAVELIRASASLVYLLDRNTSLLQVAGGYRIPTTYHGLTLALGTDVAGRAARSGRAFIVDNYSAWEERTHVFDEVAPDSIRPSANCAVAIPLTYNRQVLGVLELLYSDGREITNKDVALLQLITPHAATAISHAQLFERSQQVMNLLEIINDRGAAVSSVSTAVINAGHNLKKMSDETLMRTVAALRLAAGKVFLSEHEGEALVTRSVYNLSADDPGLARVAAHCASVRQTILLQNMTAFAWTQDITHWLAERHMGALVAVPLIAEEEVVGVLEAIAPLGRPFDTGELDTLHIITGQLALGVSNARLFARVRAEQQQISAILGSSGDAIIGLDANGRVQVANPAAERALSFAIIDSVGKPLAEVTLNAALNATVDNAIKTQQAQPAGFEVQLANESFLFCNLSPIVDPAGRLSGWVAVMQDITHFKETERMKSDMILTASHDLRNPVNLTMGALDLLGKRAENLTPVQKEALELSLLGVHRIEALIKDLLDLERIERRVGLRLNQCNLAEITQTVVTELALPVQQRQQQLLYEHSGGAASVLGDAQRLYQVVSNLVGNAIKYTQPGGIVTVTLRAGDDQVRLEVRDTGPGISPEAQARIFERFYRAPSVATDERGTGLGLAIVKSIVEQHGGRVWVTSVVGQGSTFSVSLPAWRDNPPASTADTLPLATRPVSI
ncbi:two-component system, OmpR family, sensor histidine kinase KdpD [Thermoflexales bacterium]|nr:two-component system, OmpR family, sensor histidine kinase KdpD [Thermoflexales bacterium]